MPATATAEPGRARPDLDLVVLVGELSRPPEERVLPSGTVLRRHELTMATAEGTETVAVVKFDPGRLPMPDVADRLLVTGRVRRRFWQAGDRTASSTEVVADAVVPLRHKARAAKALQSSLVHLRQLASLLGE